MIVLDCSVVADLILAPNSFPAPDPEDTWHAPALLDSELVSVMRGLLLGGRIDVVDAREALDAYTELGIRIWPASAPLRRRCLDLAHNLSAYDAAYVALAESLGAPLLTRDARLAAAAPRTADVRIV